jgi:hypothetical protein
MWPPFATFLIHRGFVSACAMSVGQDPFRLDSYARWDSVFYLDIAARGYAPPFPCPAASGYAPSAWCGNAGWFPGYPWAIQLIGHLGASKLLAAFLLAAAAQLLCLVVVWEWTGDRVVLALAAFFPGNIYMVAVFPTSLFTCLALLTLLCCWTGRSLRGGAAGLAAATCHPLGPLLALIAAWWWWLYRQRRGWFVAACILGGWAVVLLVFHFQAGSWDAYYRTQAKYGYHVGMGLNAWLSRLKPLVNPRYRDAKGFTTALQTLWCAALLVGLFASPRPRITAWGRSVLLYFVFFWAAPLSLGGSLSLYRSEALLLPGTLAVASFPRRAKVAFLVAAVVISVPMARLFFSGVLV